MKFAYNCLWVLFCLCTLGIVDIQVKYSDGSKFEWVGWVSRIQRWMEG